LHSWLASNKASHPIFLLLTSIAFGRGSVDESDSDAPHYISNWVWGVFRLPSSTRSLHSAHLTIEGHFRTSIAGRGENVGRLLLWEVIPHTLCFANPPAKLY